MTRNKYLISGFTSDQEFYKCALLLCISSPSHTYRYYDIVVKMNKRDYNPPLITMEENGILLMESNGYDTIYHVHNCLPAHKPMQMHIKSAITQLFIDLKDYEFLDMSLKDLDFILSKYGIDVSSIN